MTETKTDVEKNVKNVASKDEKANVVAKTKTPVLTIASVFQFEAKKGAKSRVDLADNIIAYLKSKNITKNGRGHDIVQPRVLQQISAMTRDINQKRGEKTNAWWSTYKVDETNGYKLIPNTPKI